VREIGFLLLEQMTETIQSFLSDQLPSLATLLGNGLRDAAPPVQAASLRALGGIMENLSSSDDLLQFRELVPHMLQVLSTTCATGACDEELLTDTLEVLYELAQTPVPLLNPHVPVLIQQLLAMVKDERLESQVRDSAGLVISALTECKPKLIGKNNLVPQILEAMVHMIAGSDTSAAGSLSLAMADDQGDEDDDDYSDVDGPTVCQIAQDCLDHLGCHLPMKYVWGPGYEASVKCLQLAEPNWRKAGAACLAQLVEGCQDPVREKLDVLLPLVLAAAQETDKHCRESACFCIGQMAEHCQPEIMNYQEYVLPVIFSLLDDQRASIQGISCYVLEMYTEHLSPTNVTPFLDDLVRKLLMLAQQPRISIQEMAVAALAAVAVAAEERFIPYASTVMQLLDAPLKATAEENYTLRGRCLECVGHIALGIKREAFAPYLDMCMRSAEMSLQLEDATELHEFTYAFFANIAKVIETDFAPFLGALVPHLCEVISSSDGQTVDFGDGQGAEGGGFTALDDSEEEDEEGMYKFLNVRTAVLETKKSAILALGLIARHSGPTFTSNGHLEQSLPALLGQVEYWNAKIRREVALACERMVMAAAIGKYGSEFAVWAEDGPAWGSGDVFSGYEGVQGDPILNHVNTTVAKVLTILMQDDPDKTVVSQACACLQSVSEFLGPSSLSCVMSPNWLHTTESRSMSLFDGTLLLLHERAPCQIGLEGEEGGAVDTVEEDEDHDNVLMDNVADLVGSYSKVFGASVLTASNTTTYGGLIEAMLKFAKISRPNSDRAMALGCFAEVFHHLKANSAPFISTLLPLMVQGIKDPSPSIRRNSAFGVGVAAMASPELVSPMYGELLQGLIPLFSVDPVLEAPVIDNAAAAVSRMIMAAMDQVPMESVLPIFMGALPLKNDMNENEPVYQCIAGLFEMRHPVFLTHLPKAIFAISVAIQVPELGDATKTRLVSCVQTMLRDPATANQIQAALSQLPEESSAILARHLS